MGNKKRAVMLPHGTTTKMLENIELISDNVTWYDEDTCDVEIHIDFHELPKALQENIREDFGADRVDAYYDSKEEGDTDFDPHIRKCFYVEIDVGRISGMHYAVYDAVRACGDDTNYEDHGRLIEVWVKDKLAELNLPMHKVTLTKSQHEALESTLNDKSIVFSKYSTIEEWIVASHSMSPHSWIGTSLALKELTLDTIIRALYSGYVVEETPEEQIKFLYEQADRNILAYSLETESVDANWWHGYKHGMRDALNKLSVYIKGVN